MEYIGFGILVLLLFIFAVRFFQYKMQIRKFTEAVSERVKTEYEKPVTVEYFDGDILALANALNAYTDLQKEHFLEYEENRRNLNNIIAGISHDFRTPLTAAKGYLQMIEKGEAISGEQEEYLKIALKKVDDLKKLSDDFFVFSKMQTEETESEQTEINVNNLLSEVLLEQYEWIEKRGLGTEFEISEKDIIIEGNPHDLKRIFENLFSNAKKYTVSNLKVMLTEEAGKLLFNMQNDFKDGDSLDVNRIFEPFYRGASRQQEGSGLGLYVVKNIAEQMGCDVSAECRNGIFAVKMVKK